MSLNKHKFNKLLAIAALGFAYFFFVKLTGLGLPCPVRLISGGRILCPGCGISRMCMSLISFDIPAAFSFNPAIFSLLPLWGVCAVFWLFDRGERFIKITEIISIVILTAFGILRNIL